MGAGRWRERWSSKLTRTEVNIAAVAGWVKNYLRIASGMIAEYLNIPKTEVPRILKEDLGRRKLCARFVLDSFDNWAKGRSSHILPRHYRVGRCRQTFFNKIITGDETWCLAYDPETKRQSSEWIREISPRPKKLKFQRLAMMIIFFDSQGVVHKEFIPKGEKK